MTNEIEVAKVHGIAITYDPEKKHFEAMVGGREIRKPSQREVEKVISKFVRGTDCAKGMILDYGWRSVTVKKIDIVGLRRTKIQFREEGRLETEDPGCVYVFDEEIHKQAEKLKKEHVDWRLRWEGLLGKASKVDPEKLR